MERLGLMVAAVLSDTANAAGNVNVTWPDRLRLYVLRGGICHICVRAVAYDEFQYEHVVPLSRTGSSEIENLALAHPRCNYVKGTRLMSEIPHVLDQLRAA